MSHAELAFRFVSALGNITTTALLWRKYRRDRQADAVQSRLERAIERRPPVTIPAWEESCRP